MTKDQKPETALAKITPEGEQLMALAEVDERFAKQYGQQLKEYAESMPTREDFDEALDELAEDEETLELAESLGTVLTQTQGNKRGMFSAEESIVFPELRIYHGVGDDANRPDSCRAGHYYLNTNDPVGEHFEGAVIAIWKGRTMWGDRDAGESTSAPLCQSMNRLVGSMCGECATCPDKPWRNGEPTRCNDDVVAFMLSRDCKRLVLVRFQKTSVKAGNKLYRTVSIGSAPWRKWWRLSLEKQTKGNNRWYVMTCNLAGETKEEYLTPKAIDKFCDLLCVNLSGTFILPGIARTYRLSREGTVPDTTTTGNAGGGSAPQADPSALDNEENLGVMDDVADIDDAPDI